MKLFMHVVYYFEHCFYVIYLHHKQTSCVYIGLPVPIVAIAAGIANEHYGSDNGLAIRTYIN